MTCFSSRVSFIFCVLLAIVSCTKTTEEISPELVALNDLGVAQMGQFRYTDAHSTFSSLVEQAPSWLDARVNLAIATLNRQEPNDELVTLRLLDEVLREDSENLRALYTSGIVHLYIGEPAKAVAHLQKVIELDPNDAYAAYFLGQSKLQNENYEEAQHWLYRAIDLNPSLRSAYWAASTATRRLGDNERAMELVETYQKFEHNPLSVTAGISYKEMGPKAEAKSTSPAPISRKPLPEGQLFALPVTIDQNITEANGITSADFNDDGYWDLLVGTSIGSKLYAFDGVGFSPVANLPFGHTPHRAALWGDLENDGVLDLVLCSDQEIQVWSVPESGWERSPIDLDKQCNDGALVDIDHDGDLDVVLLSESGLEVLGNNLDGTFRALSEDMGIQVDGTPVSIAFGDLDSDRDVDFAVLTREGRLYVWRNHRTWRFTRFELPIEMTRDSISLISIADFNNNGIPDLLLLRNDGFTSWNYVDGAWGKISTASYGGEGVVKSLLAADLYGSGVVQGWVQQQGIGSGPVDSDKVNLTFGIPSNPVDESIPFYVGPGVGPGRVSVGKNGLQLHPPGLGRHQFIDIVPTGKTSADQMRSNASGIGTKIKVRVQGQWASAFAIDNSTVPGQSLIPTSIGLGGHEKADYVELTWSDGVTQSEINLASGELHRIEETQRQLASCPVVFAWNGHKYEFISDVLGTSALGLFLEPGVTVPVRTLERMLFPIDSLKPNEGRFHVKIGEPMEEILYLDSASLHQYEIPHPWDMVLDERANVNGRAPTGRPIFFRESISPSFAFDQNGKDVTESIVEADRVAADPGELDRRYVGLLDSEYILTLSFDEALPQHRTVLVVDGWMEYPYSQTVFAAWQSGVSYDAATLEVWSEATGWRILIEEFGYPAGMPRTMALPLPTLPKGVTKLRMRTNMEIYWDRVRIVIENSPAKINHRELPLAEAQVKRSGFALRSTGPQRQPYYDYSQRAPYWDAKYADGMYTTYGPVTELVNKTDSAVAIVGSGEEVHLEFLPSAEGVAEGMFRHYVVDFHGWAKDMDMYTDKGETVEPIPALSDLDGDQKDIRNRLHQKYNVRFQAGMPPH